MAKERSFCGWSQTSACSQKQKLDLVSLSLHLSVSLQLCLSNLVLSEAQRFGPMGTREAALGKIP